MCINKSKKKEEELCIRAINYTVEIKTDNINK